MLGPLNPAWEGIILWKSEKERNLNDFVAINPSGTTDYRSNAVTIKSELFAIEGTE